MHISNVNGSIPLGTYNWSLSQVNILIGPNGSGKSLILHNIKEQQNYFKNYEIPLEYVPHSEHPVLKKLLRIIELPNGRFSYGQVCLYDILRRVNYLKNTQQALLVLDNIEIGLDIDTQRRLINWILEIYPNIQLIISTHSPCVLAEWHDSMTDIRDILSLK